MDHGERTDGRTDRPADISIEFQENKSRSLISLYS